VQRMQRPRYTPSQLCRLKAFRLKHGRSRKLMLPTRLCMVNTRCMRTIC